MLALAAALALASCRSGENGQRGGESERNLVEATVAADLARVKQLLAAGADANKMAPHESHLRSPWKLALDKARRDRPDTVAIVLAMVQSGASPDVRWGEARSVRGGYSVQRGSPLLDALSIGSADVVRALMQAQPRPSVGGVAGCMTPLVAAVETRNVALISYLEDHGAREKP